MYLKSLDFGVLVEEHVVHGHQYCLYVLAWTSWQLDGKDKQKNNIKAAQDKVPDVQLKMSKISQRAAKTKF